MQVFGWSLLLSFLLPVPAFVLMTERLQNEVLPVPLSHRIWSAVLAQLAAALSVPLIFTYFVWGPILLVCFIGAAIGGWAAYGLLLIWLGQSRQTSFWIANCFFLASFISLWSCLGLFVRE